LGKQSTAATAAASERPVIPSLLGRLPRLIFFSIGLSLALVLATAGVASAQGQMAGIQTHLMWGQYDAADVEQQLNAARDAGATTVRVDVGWSSIEEQGKGRWNQYHLRRVDNIIDQANARGIKPLVTFWETPCWASTAPETIKQGCAGAWWGRGVQRYTPVNPSDYADALAFMVARYKGKVAAWEIWNEPNSDDYFKANDPLGSYAALVKAAYPAAKAADPNAVIVAGSLMDSDFAFTEELLKRGVGGNFDGWSVHPYSGDQSPLDRADDRWIKTSFVRGVPAVRETLLRHGQDVPLWLTEFGWSNCTFRGGEKWQNCVSEGTQATHLKLAFEQMRNWSYVKAAYWFNMQDTSDAPDERLENYGLLRIDGSPKPAYNAFAQAARDLGNGPTNSSGSGSGNGSDIEAEGDLKAEAQGGRITLRASRKGKRVKVVGTAPRGRVVKISAYRYVAGKKRFSGRASHTIKVRVDRRGRYSRTLRKTALRSGRWRITARLTGVSTARFARADIGKRKRRPAKSRSRR
jgi:hypothetical protein